MVVGVLYSTCVSGLSLEAVCMLGKKGVIMLKAFRDVHIFSGI